MAFYRTCPKCGANLGKDVLTDKDLYCIARILQGSIFEDNLFYGCKYCRYAKECSNNHTDGKNIHLEEIRSKLQRITGIDLGYKYNPNNPQKKFAYQNCLASACFLKGQSGSEHSSK